MPPPEDFQIIHCLWMYEWGCLKPGQYYCTEACPIPSTAHYYIVAPFEFDWGWALLEFVKRGVDVKNCLICKYCSKTLDGRICTLYKKFGTPRQPQTTEAKKCKYFRLISDAPMIRFDCNVEYWSDFIKKQESAPEYKVVIRKKEGQ